MIYQEAKSQKSSGQEVVKISQPFYKILELTNGEVVYFPIGVMAISPEMLESCPRVPSDDLQHTDWDVIDIVPCESNW